jgi:hypothetical protein
MEMLVFQLQIPVLADAVVRGFNLIGNPYPSSLIGNQEQDGYVLI